LILDWYIDPQTSTQKKDLVQALGLITAGVAGAVGIFFTWRGQKLAREAQENNQRNTQEQLTLSRQSQEQNQQSTQAQLENAQEELRLTRQGQITERFTRAIEQLGSEKLEIRLGGIYALERIDKESPERAYHGTVMEVLTAYVRENSRWEPEEPSTSTPASNEGIEQDKGGEQDAQPTLRRLPTDILAILEVLIRREEERVPEEHQVFLDLREATLLGVNLQETNLQETNLQGANLQGANLRSANFREAWLPTVDLREAFLATADLQEANLQGANLQEAILLRADLDRANFQKAKLQRAILERANLQGVIFQGANLERATFLGANLQQATLDEAFHLSHEQIKWTVGSNETDLPEDLERPESWSLRAGEQARILREHFGGG
jgi:uncharacterized protein YjbI with pentapeptide repeats